MSKKSYYYIFFLSLALAILCGEATQYFFPQISNSQCVSTAIFIPQIGLLFTSVILYKQLEKKSRKIFFWFFLAMTALLINGVNFYYLIYIKKYPQDTIPFFLFLSYWIPFITWLTTAIVFLSKIIVPNILDKIKFYKILSIFFLLNFLMMFLFFSSLKDEFFVFSGVILSQAFACTYKLVVFDLAMLCLICVEDTGMLILLSGIAMLLSADFLFNYSSVAKISHILLYGELSWLFATFLMFLGVLYILKNANYKIENAFRKTSSIKSHLISWTFSVSIISFMLFFSAAYFFSLIDKVVFAGLPFFIMTYSVILVILSSFMGKRLESPFKILTFNIENFLWHKKKLVAAFSIEEFAYLQKFLLDMFEINERKNKAEKELGRVAAQVAHDIRSPLLAMDSFFYMIEKKLDESERVFGKRSMRRLDDIAWSLLSRYKNKEDVSSGKSYVFLYSALLELIAEKRMEYSKCKIEFDVKINPMDAFSLVFINSVPLKRMLSNIINNAVNAILPNNGLIMISMECNIAGTLISIKDNGQGLAAERLQEIIANARSEKAKANLGLPHAIQFLNEIGGHFEMASVEGEGSEVSISLPPCESPHWCLNEYSVSQEEQVFIIDDSQSVHDVWEERVRILPGVSCKHLHSPEEALDFFKEKTNSKNWVIFCDYEFFGSEINGLQILEALPNDATKFLVTSHFYDAKIMKQAIDCGVKVLPKDLLPYFQLKSLKVLNERTPSQLIFIDDDVRNTESWEFFARAKNVKIQTYDRVDDFFKDAVGIDKLIPVYIDLNLNMAKNGIEYAKEIHALGFKTIYIATGALDLTLKTCDYPWLTGIIEKRFPL